MLASERRQSSRPPGRRGGQTGTSSSSTTDPVFLRCGVTPSLYFLTRQRLSINVPAVSVAENMMDLIDGYCRLENDTDGTVIYRPNKGTCGQGYRLYQNKLR